MVALGGAAVSYERGTPVQPFVYGMGWPCPAKMQPLASRGPPTEPTTPIDCSNPRFFMSDSWGGGAPTLKDCSHPRFFISDSWEEMATK